MEPAKTSQNQPKPAKTSQNQPKPAKPSQTQPNPAKTNQYDSMRPEKNVVFMVLRDVIVTI